MTTAARARTAALAAFDWLAAAAVPTDDGRAWTENGAVDDCLYSGSVGVLLACAEATAAGLDVAATAALARDRVLTLVSTDRPDVLEDDSLFVGWAGAAVALRAWDAAVTDADALAAAEVVTTGLAARAAMPFADGCTDIIQGDAGLLIALVTTGAPDAAAGLVADRLVDAAEPGPQWRMVPDHPILMPNFSHGTAGVSYALLLAGRRLGRPELMAHAIRGAETLIALSETPSGWAAPMTIPRQAHRSTVSFGWCHGPSGTVKLFELLAALQPDDPRWPRTVAQCYEAVRTSGLPERHTPGFWDNVARCCGTAGVGSMVLDRYQATGDPAILAWADELAEDVLARAIETPQGIAWSNHEHTATPPDLPPEPGFMQGAAGIAGWLARLAAAHDDPHATGLGLGVVPRWI